MECKRLAIQAVKYALRDLRFEGVEIEFKEASFFLYPEINAIFVQELYVIVFNETWLVKASEADIILSAFHETRHAYQKVCTEFKEVMIIDVDNNTLKQWAYEFENYINFSEGNYEAQSIEIDAQNYSNSLFKTLENQILMFLEC